MTDADTIAFLRTALAAIFAEADRPSPDVLGIQGIAADAITLTREHGPALAPHGGLKGWGEVCEAVTKGVAR